MHQVRSLSALDDSLCEYRQLSCFCIACMDKFSRLPCISKDHVEEWSLTRLRVVKPHPAIHTRIEGRARIVQDNQRCHVPAGPEVPLEIVDDQILLGHNVAVPIDLDDEPFWLLLVTKSPHEVEVEFVDHYDNTWKPGDLLIRGYY
jgi:hypothetical protein